MEIILFEELENLKPLENYSGIKALTLDTGFVDFAPLYQMKDLELLVLGESYFDDSLKMEALQNTLPKTKIVPGGGMCLGSGWILLLLPILSVLLVFKTRLIKSRPSRTIE